jgi:hypothetical protein
MKFYWIGIHRWFVFSRECPVHVQRGYRLSRFRKEGTDMDMHRDVMKFHKNVYHYQKPYCVHDAGLVSRSNFKLTLRDHYKMLVWSKTSTCIEGFRYSSAQMITIAKRNVARKIRSRRPRSRPYIQENYEDVKGNHLVIFYGCIANGHYPLTCDTAYRPLIYIKLLRLVYIVTMSPLL